MTTTTSDAEFLEAFEDATLEGFAHRDHVRVSWLYLRDLEPDAATRAVEQGIRRYATAKGAADKYHQTITTAWVRLVAGALRQTPGGSFEEFLAAHPDLLDRDRLLRHYRPPTLASAEARRRFVEPELEPLPG